MQARAAREIMTTQAVRERHRHLAASWTEGRGTKTRQLESSQRLSDPFRREISTDPRLLDVVLLRLTIGRIKGALTWRYRAPPRLASREWPRSVAPIAELCLNQGERGDRRRVGAENPGAERQAQHLREGQEEVALLGIEAAFRADQDRERSGRL